MKYPAGIICESNGDGYTVYFPDLPNIVIGGRDMDEALANAADWLALFLRGENPPSASTLKDAREKVRAIRAANGLSLPADALFQYISPAV